MDVLSLFIIVVFIGLLAYYHAREAPGTVALRRGSRRTCGTRHTTVTTGTEDQMAVTSTQDREFSTAASSTPNDEFLSVISSTSTPDLQDLRATSPMSNYPTSISTDMVEITVTSGASITSTEIKHQTQGTPGGFEADIKFLEQTLEASPMIATTEKELQLKYTEDHVARPTSDETKSSDGTSPFKEVACDIKSTQYSTDVAIAIEMLKLAERFGVSETSNREYHSCTSADESSRIMEAITKVREILSELDLEVTNVRTSSPTQAYLKMTSADGESKDSVEAAPAKREINEASDVSQDHQEGKTNSDVPEIQSPSKLTPPSSPIKQLKRAAASMKRAVISVCSQLKRLELIETSNDGKSSPQDESNQKQQEMSPTYLPFPSEVDSDVDIEAEDTEVAISRRLTLSDLSVPDESSSDPKAGTTSQGHIKADGETRKPSPQALSTGTEPLKKNNDITEMGS